MSSAKLNIFLFLADNAAPKKRSWPQFLNAGRAQQCAYILYIYKYIYIYKYKYIYIATKWNKWNKCSKVYIL